MVARRAHNPEVAGSNPAPATNFSIRKSTSKQREEPMASASKRFLGFAPQTVIHKVKKGKKMKDFNNSSQKTSKSGTRLAKAILVCSVVALLAVCMCACNGSSAKTYTNSNSNNNSNSSNNRSTTNSNSNTNSSDSSSFTQTDKCVIEVKDYGTITVGLDANAAPITVENFKKLVNEGFYDGLTFHRIISNFMIQGGDPNGDGTGGSSQTIKGEFISNGVNNTLKHTRGAISMARSQSNDSASSQFFIVHQTSDSNSRSLDGKYACFGYVTEGMEVVDKICESVKTTDSNGTVSKADQPVITSIKMA